MSKQMIQDWIEEEYDLWKSNEIVDPLGTADSSQYVARAFAFYMLEKYSHSAEGKN